MNAARKQITRWSARGSVRATDELAAEEPLEIRIDSRPIVVTMRTPGHDDELAAGFLFTEGLIHSLEDVRSIRKNARNRSGNSLDVFLAPDVAVDFARFKRHGFVSSSCGVCGKESIRAVQRRLKPVVSRLKVSAKLSSVAKAVKSRRKK